jgi:hypothetical protein
MDLTATISYPGTTPERVFTMLADPKFQEEKCAATGALSYDVDIAEVADTTVITCRRVLPTDDLPDFVRPFASGGLNLTETVAWSAPDSAGGRIGEVTLAFKAQPLSMRGELHMVADAEGTTATLHAKLVAAVPLLGGRIERACEPLVQAALRTEERLGRTWLADHE